MSRNQLQQIHFHFEALHKALEKSDVPAIASALQALQRPLAPPCLVECERCGCVVDLNDCPTTLLSDGWGDFEKVPVCPTCGQLLA